ncbi:hypothetical protein Naga_100417g1 [Nannochloropsis gaditana]|uniref:Uncharacterized protein n=1 Tax=Nannochloropsis gaditana TaxID=72520 RepID=W7SZV5_9STRA|nr:hypothetical protein Naga_100417g1 [Nannochloropsis gaditana]
MGSFKCFLRLVVVDIEREGCIRLLDGEKLVKTVADEIALLRHLNEEKSRGVQGVLSFLQASFALLKLFLQLSLADPPALSRFSKQITRLGTILPCCIQCGFLRGRHTVAQKFVRLVIRRRATSESTACTTALSAGHYEFLQSVVEPMLIKAS